MWQDITPVSVVPTVRGWGSGGGGVLCLWRLSMICCITVFETKFFFPCYFGRSTAVKRIEKMSKKGEKQGQKWEKKIGGSDIPHPSMTPLSPSERLWGRQTACRKGNRTGTIQRLQIRRSSKKNRNWEQGRQRGEWKEMDGNGRWRRGK